MGSPPSFGAPTSRGVPGGQRLRMHDDAVGGAVNGVGGLDGQLAGQGSTCFVDLSIEQFGSWQDTRRPRQMMQVETFQGCLSMARNYPRTVDISNSSSSSSSSSSSGACESCGEDSPARLLMRAISQQATERACAGGVRRPHAGTDMATDAALQEVL
ncbi:hypothetical protein HRS9139_01923 [Pyrenophora teres f. teres]|nr:hypothetical protein HRS9139_01923 [Pyrenophora teres f. teres]KAE8870326.1 hypothetical protein PTNB29_00670 [Pyrenophora teres f. teres]